MKHNMKIHLADVMAVKDLVDLVSKFPGSVNLVYADKTVDAKSIMSIFTLDLTGDLQLEIDGNITPEMLESLEPYKV